MEMCDANLEEFVKGTRKLGGLMIWSGARKEDQIQYAINSIMGDVVRGLVFIHSHDEVHRDLSPQNSTPWQVLS